MIGDMATPSQKLGARDITAPKVSTPTTFPKQLWVIDTIDINVDGI